MRILKRCLNKVVIHTHSNMRAPSGWPCRILSSAIPLSRLPLFLGLNCAGLVEQPLRSFDLRVQVRRCNRRGRIIGWSIDGRRRLIL